MSNHHQLTGRHSQGYRRQILRPAVGIDRHSTLGTRSASILVPVIEVGRNHLGSRHGKSIVHIPAVHAIEVNITAADTVENIAGDDAFSLHIRLRITTLIYTSALVFLILPTSDECVRVGDRPVNSTSGFLVMWR